MANQQGTYEAYQQFQHLKTFSELPDGRYSYAPAYQWEFLNEEMGWKTKHLPTYCVTSTLVAFDTGYRGLPERFRSGLKRALKYKDTSRTTCVIKPGVLDEVYERPAMVAKKGNVGVFHTEIGGFMALEITPDEPIIVGYMGD